MFTLFVPFFKEKNQQRLDEYLFCLEKNIANQYIKEIYLFFEHLGKDTFSINEWLPEITKHEKVKIKYCKRDKPRSISYLDFIVFANKTLQKGEQFIISNMDIFFDETLSLISENPIKERVYALTRYNYKSYKGVLDREWKRESYSQDSWFFSTPAQANSRFDLNLGWIGCDNRIAYELDRANYEVLNISETIKTWHVHAETAQKTLYQDNYSYKFDGKPYKFLPFITLEETLDSAYKYVKLDKEVRKVLEWQIGVYKKKIENNDFLYFDGKTQKSHGVNQVKPSLLSRVLRKIKSR